MYEKLEVCPLCKSTNFKNFIICKDHMISGESFALNKCTKCELVFTNPRPDVQSLSKYYDSDQYISHTNKSNNIINFVYKLVRIYTTRKKIKIIKEYSKGKSVLDYGCGTGKFLEACKKAGYDTTGLEPNDIARAQAKTKGLNVIENLKKHKEKVDIITLWHVLEHVSDLKKTIKSLKKNLKKDGILLIAVPNMNSFDAHHYKGYWAAYDVPRHLYHFTKVSFGRLVVKSKMSLIDTIPMKFDAYYVSLLSEKYSLGKINLINALKIGFKSNRQASKNGEYSSLIYVLKK